MGLILTIIVLNILSVGVIFTFLWFTAQKNKDFFSEKTSNIQERLNDLGCKVVELEEKILPELKIILPHINDLKECISETKQESLQAKELSKKVSDQHGEFHGEMLEKLNKAGELIVGYETFFENTLVELDEITRFIDVLSKRPSLSNDPDYANFTRAVQLMVQTISRYSSVADNLRKESKEIKTD